MNQGNAKRNGSQNAFFREMLRLTILGIALLLMTIFLPLFRLMLFLMPILMSLLLLTLPKGYAFGALCCWLAFAAFVVQSQSLVYMLLLFALLSFSLFLLKFKAWPPSWMIGVGSLVMTAGILLGLYLLANGKGDMLSPFMQGYEQAIRQEQGMLKDFMDSTGLTLDSLMKQIKRMVPGMLFGLSILCSLVNYYGTFYILRKRRVAPVVPHFSEFALPGNVFGGVLLIYFFLFLLKMAAFPLIEVVELNLVWVFALLFFLQGLAVLRFWTKQKVPFLLGWTLLFGALLFAPFSMAVLAMGFFDGAFNFRRLPR